LFFCKTTHVLRNLTTVLQALYKESFITKNYTQKLNLYKFKYGHPASISNKIHQLFSETRRSYRKMWPLHYADIDRTHIKGASDLIGTKNVKIYIEICYEEENISVCSPWLFFNETAHIFLLHYSYPRLFFIQICKSNCVTNYSVTCMTSILSVRKFRERKRQSIDILPLTSAKGLTGVEMVSLAVMSLSLRCCSSSSASTLDLMSVVSTKPASAVSVSPADDVLLKHYTGLYIYILLIMRLVTNSC